MRRLIFWTTVLSGAVAAFVLYRQGVAPAEIAEDVFTHPVKTFIDVLHTPAQQPREA